jgi:hypothetical protein
MDNSNEVIKIQEQHADALLQFVEENHHQITDKKYHVYFGRTCMKSFLSEKEANDFIETMPNICVVMVFCQKGPGK